MSDAGHDLRDAECFGRWVDTLPADLAGVLRQTAMTYLEFDDAISIVVPHALGPILRKEDMYRRLTLWVAGHYDESRSRWIAFMNKTLDGTAPLAAVAPRVRFEIAPRTRSAH